MLLRSAILFISLSLFLLGGLVAAQDAPRYCQ
jgi:hypothetical protein